MVSPRFLSCFWRSPRPKVTAAGEFAARLVPLSARGSFAFENDGVQLSTIMYRVLVLKQLKETVIQESNSSVCGYYFINW